MKYLFGYLFFVFRGGGVSFWWVLNVVWSRISALAFYDERFPIMIPSKAMCICFRQINWLPSISFFINC